MESEKDPSKLFVDDPENGLFFFETDHLALRGNKDYCDVLKTIVTLSAFRERAIKDYNKIVELKKKVLENPWTLVEKLKNGEGLGIDTPPLLDLPKLPVINFSKFDIKVPESEIAAIYSDSVNVKPDDESKKIPSNSKINNKAWTPEEQKRLEELLYQFPPEPVEMRRFQKIADALGNRTVRQVSSRVQKYFLKLFKSGLPIPGRIPKSQEKYRKSSLHQHQRFNHYLTKPTTFFPDLCVPVTMNDCDDAPGPSTSAAASGTSSNYLFHSDYHKDVDSLSHKTDNERKLELLKRLKAEKLKEQEVDYFSYKHSGFKCDYCDADPILGSRWHCLTCKESIDFCTDCVLSQLYSSEPHPLNHILIVVSSETELSTVLQNDSVSQFGSISTKNNDIDSDSEDLDEIHNIDFKIEEENDETMDHENECKYREMDSRNINIKIEDDIDEIIEHNDDEYTYREMVEKSNQISL